ncbi:MAG: serine/threonine protein kinase, partial [Dehalococcoidia bacterium]
MSDGTQARLDQDPLLTSVPEAEGYKVLGGVVLYQKLGQGGMGAVYRGRHLRLNIDVAVKVMDPPAGIQASQSGEFVRRFVREAQTAASIQHSNLIRVYDVNSEAGVHFLIMDFVDGESASDRLKRKAGPGPRRGLGEAEAVEITLGAAEGLAEAHRRGIVHRDVKPDNIMIDKEGRVRVTDLGLAKAASGESDSAPSLLTQTQAAMGTPSYMPPEQFVSARDVGPRADVWSL